MKLRRIEKAFLNNRFRVGYQHRREAPQVFRDVPAMPEGHCLELGCGYGNGLELIREHTACRQVTGIDIDPAMARTASAKGAGLVIIADAVRLPFGDASFEGVFHFFVYDHIPLWRNVIHDVFRVLKPGGVYAFEEALLPQSRLLFHRYFGHVAIGAGELRDALIQAGFTVRRFDTGSWRCFVMAEKPANG